VTPERLRALLADVASGALPLEEAERRLAWAPVEDLDFARVDHHRALRQGFPEVVFGQGKTPEQIAAIGERIAARGDGFLATRVATEAHELLRRTLPAIEINQLGRTAWLPATNPARRNARGTVLIVTAGTSDLPVAEEAAVTAAAFGNSVARLTDVGVAGIHRLLAARDTLGDASVVIVVAGMEGALPSVVGGLVAVPVIAVPTSVGYGASFGGVSALLGMLNSCASGVTVVNIDNGFGAAAAASRINLLPPS
jgi:NCAIR mutase (PurE)-related protein